MPGAGDGELMPAAELKPLLLMSKRRPVSCAVALTRDKQAVLLLDRKLKPRKLMAELKSKAKSESLEVDTVSVRFGRVAVDPNDGTAVFTLNKAAPAAIKMKLVEKLRPAGVRKVELGVDEALEDEGEDDADGADGEADGLEAGSAPRTGRDGQASGAADQAGLDAGAKPGSGVAASGAAALPTGDGDTGPGPAAGAGLDAATGAARGAPGKAASARRLASLVQKAAAALPGHPPGEAEMRAAATAGQAAIKSGDLAGAGQATDTLERLLEGQATDHGRSGAGSGAALDGGDTGAGGTPPVAGASTSANPDGAEAGSSKADAPPTGARQPVNARMFAKGCQAWRATRAKMETDIQAVIKEVASHHGTGGDEADVVRRAFEPLIHTLDDRLAAKLDEAGKASDAAAHAKLAGEAQGIIREYEAFVDGSPMVAQLDRNPFHPVSVRRTLDTALAALSRVVGSKGG